MRIPCISNPLVVAALGSILSCSAALALPLNESADDHDRCPISGPSRVSAGESFTLCGPSGEGLDYKWTGSGVRDSRSRCTRISGLDPGTYTFRLEVSGGRNGDDDDDDDRDGDRGREEGQRKRHGHDDVSLCRHTVIVTGANGDCISGPTRIDVGESVTLCAPSGAGLSYRWEGQGITDSNDNDRCITIRNLAEGTYDYSVRVRRSDGTSRTCDVTVTVGNGGGDCITGPTNIDNGESLTLCAPSGSGLSYRWEGQGLTDSNDNDRCVTIRNLAEGTYDYSVRVRRSDGTSHTCNLTVTVGNGNGSDCITGPTHIDHGESLTLCAPSGSGLRYTWDGQGITDSNDNDRCVTIRNLAEGTYDYSVRVRRSDGTSRTCDLTVTVGNGGGDCISGPTHIDVGESLTLCAPSGSGLSYRWQGQGITDSNDNDRCVTIANLATGTYDYSVRVRRSDGTSRTCNVTVTVGNGAGDCITGPTHIDVGESLTLCAPSGSGVSYRWAGRGITDSNDNDRCVTIRNLAQGTYDYSVRVRRSDGTSRTCNVRVVVGGEVGECITGPTEVFENDDFTLCGPSGFSNYRWTGLGVDQGDNRCLDITQDVATGFHTYVLTFTDHGTVRTCSYRVHVFAANEACVLGLRRVDVNQGFTLCGPPTTGMTFVWRGSGVPADSTSRCVSIPGRATGLYRYTLISAGVAGPDTCTFVVRVGDLQESSCPLPMQLWGELCNFSNGGTWRDTLGLVTGCVDAQLGNVDWNDSNTSFCNLLTSTDPSVRNALGQQLAALVANLCARDLALTGPEGVQIGLDANADARTDIGGVNTIADLVTYADSLLSRSDDSFVTRLRMARAAMAIAELNRGRDTDCERTPGVADQRVASLLHQLEREAIDSGQTEALELGKAYPNPFRETTRLRFAIATGGERVAIGVYDVAGRLVNRLASGNMTAGIHEVEWNGTSSGGTRVQSGIYFLRGNIGDRPLTNRIMLLK